ncbi:hypothetical protein KY366_02710 [Candidatus Woesearchaeota archaeon]|nr:hypothetical protein [Candidatus Woesearchaeota archaeon]
MVNVTEGLQFLNEFFINKKFEVEDSTITLDERPSFDVRSEDYHFRVVIAEVVDEVEIYYRDIAIEDHHRQDKHKKPHLQFKLHADGIGNIHIFLPINDAKDYKKYIFSFLDIIGSILVKMDNEKKELQHKFMRMDKFKEIEGMGDNIKKIVCESYKQGKLKLLTVDRETRVIDGEYLKRIKGIPQIEPFFEKL